jgi:D-alanyl-D-alanine carboxypeptidase
MIFNTYLYIGGIIMDKLDIKNKGLLVKGKINISKEAIESKFKSLIGDISRKDIHLMKVSIVAYVSAMGVITILSMPGIKIDTNTLHLSSPTSTSNLLDDFSVDEETEKEMIRKAIIDKMALDFAAKNAFPKLENNIGEVLAPELDADNEIISDEKTTQYSLNGDAIAATVSNANKQLNEKYKDILLTESDFIIDSNMNRYIEYYKRHSDMKAIDVITYVNIGLDNKYYEGVTNIENQTSPLVICNKYNKLSNDYVPNGFSKETEKTTVLKGEAGTAFDLMVNGAKKDGLNIYSASSYRSYAYHERRYNEKVRARGQEDVDKTNARPGYSEHQSGLAADIISTDDSFANTREAKWLFANAHKYGYILRYPKGKEQITGYSYESWHYRYIGKKIAKVIYENNLTYEEFYGLYILPVVSKDKSALNLSGDEFYNKYLNKFFEYKETRSIIAEANYALEQANKDIRLSTDESEVRDTEVETLVLTK